MFDPRRVGRQLDRARRGYGGRDWPASFADRLTSPLPGFADVLRMVRQTRPGRAALLAEAARIPVHRDGGLPDPPPGQVAATWVGHATFVLRLGGATVLTDPVWSAAIPGRIPRLTPPGLPLAAVGQVDAVLISHNHYDHLDAPTIRRLGRDTPVLVPGMLGSWFRRRGFRRVTELDWWESVRLGGVTFTFVPAHHWSRRTLTDTCRTLWGGWLLDSGSRRVYFAGDTGYGHWFSEIGRRYPGIDLALLPVGAYEPAWFMRPVHMNPPEAVRACDDLGARAMAEPLLAPVERARRSWAAAGRTRADLWDLAIGASGIV
jgi:L-ascorbate metabolism protein UlaG (beta-lactamase superfamily)